MRKVLFALLPLFTLLLAPPCWAVERWALTEFRLAQFNVFESNGGYSLSAELSWNPSFLINDYLDLRANVGMSVLKGALGSALPLTEMELLVGLSPVNFLDVELGGGTQIWFLPSIVVPEISTGLVGHVRAALFGSFSLDHVFADYSLGFAPGYLAHQAKVGVGVKW
ncbi:MAG: hypothetical protein ACXWPM_08830 [Bdellovibrionota bacterium]